MIKPIKVHPVESASIILWGDDGNKEHRLIKAENCVASVISFDKRQIWEVYPYKRYSCDTEYCGACEKKDASSEWIPVSDKLPETYGAYLVQDVNGIIFVDYWRGYWLAKTTMVAWRKLPELYKRGGTE